MSVEEAKSIYSWRQDDNSIVVSFELPVGTVKSDIEYQLSPDRLTVGLKDSGILLSGDLYNKVDVDASSWIISDKKVYVFLLQFIPADYIV